MPRMTFPIPAARCWALATIAAAALAAAPPARGASIPLTADLSSRTEGLASFSGSLAFSAVTDTNASLVIELTNTTPAALGGFLTGFASNNPSDAITGLSLTSAPANFSATLGSNTIGYEPFGRFDVEVKLGPGNPNRGLGVGQSGTFAFALTGSGFNALSSESFLLTFSVPPGAGQGVRVFAVRFQAIGEGSDRVPALAIPEPSSLLSLGLGLGGVGLLGGAIRRRRRTR